MYTFRCLFSRSAGRLILLSAGWLLTVNVPCRASDNLYREALSLKAGHAADLKKLAAWCEEQGLTAEAKKTRDVLGRQDPLKLYLPILPQEVGPPELPDDAPPTVAKWHARLLKLRDEQATALYDLARQAVRKRQASLAYQLVLDVIRENPDHEGARRVLGYQKFQNQWHTAYEAKKLRAGMVWHDKFGWIGKANVARYEGGERLVGSRWISAEADERLHRDIRSGWEIETEHYLIRTNLGIEGGVALGAKLETLHRLWQQIFIRYYASESYVDALFSGRGQARRNEPPRFDVVYFRNRDDYNKALVAEMPDIGISMGVYVAKSRKAYFFAGGEDADRVLYHEATHQLFQQSRRVPNDIGYRANFWIIEGIAMYMESLHQEDGYHVLGGADDVRMTAARYHLLKQDFYVPFATLSRMGMKEIQSHPKIARLYSQMAAMTSFLVYHDGGRYRDALVAAISAVYSGSQDPAILAQLTGESYGELDRQYRQFIETGLSAGEGTSGGQSQSSFDRPKGTFRFGSEARRDVGSPSEGRSPGSAANTPNPPFSQRVGPTGQQTNDWPVGPFLATPEEWTTIPGLRPSLDEQLGLRPAALAV